MSDAVRVGDPHSCPIPNHVGGVVITGAKGLVIGKRPAATLGDLAGCAAGPPDVIAEGAATIWVNGVPLARVGSKTAHGGSVDNGESTVVVGGPAFVARSVSLHWDENSGELWLKYGKSIYIGLAPGRPWGTGDALPDYQSLTLAALMRLELTPTMQRAFHALEQTGHTVLIEMYYPNPGENARNAFAQARGEAENASRPGIGTSSVVRWDPRIHWVFPSESFRAGADIWLAHELIHATHNAQGVKGSTPCWRDNLLPTEERNTVGLPSSVFQDPGYPLDPWNGVTLPDTRSRAFTENQVRADYAERGMNSPVTGAPPVPRTSYSPNGFPF